MASPLAARSLSRVSAALAARSSPVTILSAQRSAFSTSRTQLSSQNQNPELPKFNLKHLSSNPRTRFWLGAVLVTLACIEGAAWVKFWPQIMGTRSDEPAPN